jgi:hypothetical protein
MKIEFELDANTATILVLLIGLALVAIIAVFA